MNTDHTKIKLHGFNNLTKTLSVNFYNICYAHTTADQQDYLCHIDEAYSTKRLQQVLCEVVDIIGADILNMSAYDYEPRGSSVACLIAEEPVLPTAVTAGLHVSKQGKAVQQSTVAHLDKSHVTAHTYPESHPDDGINTIRVDMDISTCGEVSPLDALDYLIEAFNEDVVILDYRIRGFTRDTLGQKHYTDHGIASIQDFLSEETKHQYRMMDMNVLQTNTFHTRMKRLDFRLGDHLFGGWAHRFQKDELTALEMRLKKEMDEIYFGASPLSNQAQ
ncbi:MAG: adenosylmethionine decarboxylase [Proteobacteria bacterium]|nr:adenosylmethionine decarboxylase [Pseudomonadota bacterium]